MRFIERKEPFSSTESALSAPAEPERLQLDRTREDFATEAVLHSVQGSALEIEIGAYLATSFSSDGTLLGQREIVTEHRPEDVIGVLVVDLKGSEPTVYTTRCLRPALLARSGNLPLLGSDASVKIDSEAGAYLTDTGIEDTARNVLAGKLGISAPFTLHSLGGPIIPNASVSPERQFSYLLVLQEKPPPTPYVLPGNFFNASREVHSTTPVEIVHDFLNGKLVDPRLFEDTCRAADLISRHFNREIRLDIPDEIRSIANALKEQLHGSQSKEPVANDSILTSEEAARLLTSPDPVPGLVSHIELTKLNEISHSNIYSTSSLIAANVNEQRKPIGPLYDVDAVVRKEDMLVVTSCVMVNGEVRMLVNIGSREALELRDEIPRALHSITRARNLEGTSGSLPSGGPEETTLDTLAKQASLIVARETGIEPKISALPTSVQGYWSPGYNTTGFRHCFQTLEITPELVENLKARNLFLMKPADILDLAEQGIVGDLPLIMSARLLSFACPEECRRKRELSQFSLETIQDFNALTVQEPPIMRFIREHSPKLASLMKHSSLLSNVITRRFNNGGLDIEKKEAGDDEAYFFNANMEVFMEHPDDNPLRVAQLLWHDLWHFEYRDELPFTTEANGELVEVPPEQYSDRIMKNEIDAVMFSEVILPELYGIDQFEDESGDRTIAGLFREAGISDPLEQRAAIEAALLDGEIVEKVVSVLKEKPGLVERFDSVIREKYLGYYVRDTLKNCRTQYDFWTKNTEVARAAIDFGSPAFTESGDAELSFSQRAERLVYGADGRFQSTGFNSLSSYLSRLKTQDIYLLSLRLAYISQNLSVKEPLREKVSEMLKNLKSAFSRLSECLEAVSGIEASEKNIRIFEEGRGIKNGIINEAKELMHDLLARDGILPPDVRRELLRRPHSPLPILPFDERGDEVVQSDISTILQNHGITS